MSHLFSELPVFVAKTHMKRMCRIVAARTGRGPLTYRDTALIALGSGFVAPAYSAGFIHVEQDIFDMDCAPCAYGIEQGLKKLAGVQKVIVSLNEGKTTLAFSPNSTTTLESIRTVIRDNGFTPKSARVTIEGKLSETQGALWLDAPGLPRYRLTGTTDAISSSTPRGGGDQLVRVSGEMPEAKSTATELKVRDAN